MKEPNSPSKKVNFIQQNEGIFDNKEFCITKIKNKLNKNPFNIILFDKKNNKSLFKKPSFSNLSVKGSIFNENNIYSKDIKSENIFDESSEKLQKNINSLLIDKMKNKEISTHEIKLEFTPKKSSAQILNKFKYKKIFNSINDKNNNESASSKIMNGREDELSQKDINENLKINGLMDTSNSDYRKEKNKIKNDFKLKPTHSFTSLPFKIENGKESIRNNENKFAKKRSIISQDNNFNKSLFSSINELFHSKADKNDNKEYNFENKIYKRYKNINEIKEDKKYFHLLYLSTNLIEIIKKKKKYQINENYKDILQKENNDKENIISNLNNQNYYITTNDRNVLKLTRLFFQKAKKAIYLFNTGKYENAYNSLMEDKIIENKKMFSLFLLTIQGIDKVKLYNFFSQNSGINKNYTILKNYLSFFNFSHQTLIISFNFLLETIAIPLKNNNVIISLFTEAYIRDNQDIIAKKEEIGKTEIKNICYLILKLNNMYDPDEENKKNKKDFIDSNINDTTINWNPDLNQLISNDPSTTAGLINFSNVCGYVYDEYMKNENSISQKKSNPRVYNELLQKKLLFNKSFSFQNSLIKNEINTNLISDTKFIEKPENKRKKISIISNNKTIFKPINLKLKKSIQLSENQIKTSNEGKEENDILDETEIKRNIKLLKKGIKISKIININGRSSKIIFTLSPDENNIILTKELCCQGKEIIAIDDISFFSIGHSFYLNTNKNFENFMIIQLNSEQIIEFYHESKELISNLVKSLENLAQKRNKILSLLSQKEKISEEDKYNIWQNDFLPNWNYYRKYIIKKKGKNLNIYLNNEENDNNKEKLLKIWFLGLPFWLRANMWKILIVNELNITEVLFQGYFQLANKEHENYNIIMKQKHNSSINCSMEMIDENYNQIELILKDCKKIIKRLKNHLNDMSNTIDFKNEVFKIVRSFCIYRPDLIYNKNISELAIFFYINCNMNEYDTFVILCNFIINNYFFKYIQNDTLFMKNHLKFFEKLIEKYLPSIHNHFKVLDFNINIFFYKWVEFLFLKTFNYNICLRIFDNFIIKGEIFIFEISLATLFILKNSIINNDQIGLVDLLKKEIIVINEDALFEYVKTLNIKKEYNDYFNLYILGKEKIELLQYL